MSLVTEKIALALKGDGAQSWTIGGICFHHGLQFRAKYKGYFYTAVVENGALVLNNRRYATPSAAAFSITRNPYTDGWCFWECQLPDQTGWISISNIKNAWHSGRMKIQR